MPSFYSTSQPKQVIPPKSILHHLVPWPTAYKIVVTLTICWTKTTIDDVMINTKPQFDYVFTTPTKIGHTKHFWRATDKLRAYENKRDRSQTSFSESNLSKEFTNQANQTPKSIKKRTNLKPTITWPQTSVEDAQCLLRETSTVAVSVAGGLSPAPATGQGQKRPEISGEGWWVPVRRWRQPSWALWASTVGPLEKGPKFMGLTKEAF